jgi:hypothetical protein
MSGAVFVMGTTIQGNRFDHLTECITDLDKLNVVKLGDGYLVLGFNQFSLLTYLPQKIVKK